MIKVVGLEELEESLRSMPSRHIPEAVSDSMERGGRTFVRVAQQRARVRTGFMRSSVFFKREGLVKIKVGAKAPHARFNEYGTRPHIIAPKTRRVLRFVKGGRTVFARRVFHPGTKPRPFIRPGLDRMLQELTPAIRDKLEEDLINSGVWKPLPASTTVDTDCTLPFGPTRLRQTFPRQVVLALGFTPRSDVGTMASSVQWSE